MERAQRIAELAENFWAGTMRHGRAKPLKGARLIEARKEHADLVNESPILFDKIAEGRFGQSDLDRLTQMLQLQNTVERKEQTQEQASKEVAEQQSKEFIEPIVKKLNKSNPPPKDGGGEDQNKSGQ